MHAKSCLVVILSLFSISTFASHELYTSKESEESFKLDIELEKAICEAQKSSCEGENPTAPEYCHYEYRRCLYQNTYTSKDCQEDQKRRRGTAGYNHFEAQEFDINSDRIQYHQCLASVQSATDESRKCEEAIIEKIIDAGWQEGGLNSNYSNKYPGLGTYYGCMNQITNPRPPEISTGVKFWNWLTGSKKEGEEIADNGRDESAPSLLPTNWAYELLGMPQ